MNKKRRLILVFLILVALVLFSLALNLLVGNVKIDLKTVLEILSGGASDDKKRNIIMNIRLPRTIMAFVLGGALAVAGFLLQTYFSNPIAGPYILGVSSGAKMMVAILLIIIAGGSGHTTGYMLIAATFVGP